MPDPYWFKSGPSIAQTIGWAAGGVLTMPLLLAGHASGIYMVGFDLLVRTAPATGTFTRGYTYSAPTIGAVSVPSTGAINLSVTGRPGTGAGASNQHLYAAHYVRSSGVTDIALVLTPASITGSPVIDVYAFAQLLSI